MTLRPPLPGDEASILEVLNADVRTAYGSEDYSAMSYRMYLESPSVEPERDIRVAETVDGTLVGYADVYREEKEGRETFWADARLAPAAPDAVEDELLDWLEERAGSDARLRSFVAGKSERMKRAVERRGYRLIRHTYRMLIALDPPPPPPVWPAGIEVRTASPGEERALHQVQQECFADHWEFVPEPFEEWAHWHVRRQDRDPDLWFVATDGDQVAGYALCFPHETERDVGWVQSLGVRRPWRRRGVGRALLLHAFAEFRRRGFAQAGLGVDAESLTGANRMYEGAGMRVVRTNNIYERERAS
jgi:mycothiol synthase